MPREPSDSLDSTQGGERRRRLSLHPLVVHFPLALLLLASAADAVSLAGTDELELWWDMSRRAMSCGVILGLLAALSGVLEIFLRPIPPRAFVWLAMHAGTMHLALMGYLVSLLMREPGPPSTTAAVIGFVAAFLLVIGSVPGGVLMFRFGIGTRQRGR